MTFTILPPDVVIMGRMYALTLAVKRPCSRPKGSCPSCPSYDARIRLREIERCLSVRTMTDPYEFERSISA